MTRFPSIRRSALRKWSLVVVVPAALYLFAACAVGSSPEAFKRAVFSASVNGIFADSFPGEPSLVDIDGFNDGQRLPGNGAQDYGPETYFYSVPRERTDVELAAEDGALVGVIDVGPFSGPSLPADYTRLHITKPDAVYCVFLRRTAVANELKGWVTVATGNLCGKPSVQTSLDAALFQIPGGGTNADYPLGTRFVEDASQHVALGVKCLTGWCEIGRGVTYKPANNPGRTLQDSIKGWHDEQQLSARTSPTGPLIRTDSSSIVPAADLGSITVDMFKSAMRNVATIHMKEDPVPGSKQHTWKLKKGVNYVWMRLASASEGRAQFTQTPAAPSPGPGFRVMRMDHSSLSTRIPGVARWVWRETDEEAWVGCDQGCCTINTDPAIVGPPSP